MISVRRVYEPVVAGEGARVLVDRVWPRGLTRADAAVVAWYKDLAPTTELRRWFAHDPARFDEFYRRYLAELKLKGHPMDDLLARVRQGNIVLVYAARDTEHNNALVLRDFLQGLSC